MVALSLYKGNLHKVPDVPRQWPIPAPTISLKDFKNLLRRRNRALSRLRSDVIADVDPTSRPNSAPSPNPNPKNTDADPVPAGNAVNRKDTGNHVGDSCSEPELPAKGDSKEGEGEENEANQERKMVDEGLVEAEDSSRKLLEKTDALAEGKNEKNNDKTEAPENPEMSNKEDSTSYVEKRTKEVKEKLEILNEKKHGLVQVLKQILSAEEQLKRQNSLQGMPGRPPLPLQVDTTNDSGSMTKVNTPRMGSDGNPSGDMEGGEGDDVSNHNMHSRHLPRMSSTSPSADSQQRKAATNMVPHPYRTTLGVAGSPSRFAPPGQGHSVTVSGASYIASSPSPAASGGTSVLRDGRLPSPWN